MKVRRCKNCNTGIENLIAKLNSITGEKWVHCDRCGNISTPIVSNDREPIIAQWNKEQKTERDLAADAAGDEE